MRSESESEVNCQASKPASNRSIKLITVHGTGAGDESKTGQGWWQLGSQFLTDLGERIDINMDSEQGEVLPFQWELGPNSETLRREAGAKLYEKLQSYEASDTDYYVVGHSHGGSVLYNALLQSVENKKPLERLKGWCTVGTPFLDYRVNRFLFQRLNGFGLTFYASGMVAIFLGIFAWLRLRGGDVENLSDLRDSLILYGTLCIAGLYLYERFRKSWYTKSQKKQAADWYSDRWLGLWHQEDEAISALTNIKDVSAEIIKSNFLKPIVALTQLAMVLLPGIYFSWDIMANSASGLLGWFDTAEKREIFLEVIVYIPFLFFYVGLVTIVLTGLAWLTGKPLSWLLNKVIWSSVRGDVWGDDVLKEDVQNVNHYPQEFPDKFGSLPKSVAEPLSNLSAQNAIQTLHNVRKVLGMNRDASSSEDLRTDLAESLKWQELIHTSYFNVPQFVDLLALGIHQAGLGEFKEAFSMTVEREELASWCGGKTNEVQ